MTQNPSSKHHFLPIFWSKWWAGSADHSVERFTKPCDIVVDKRVPPVRCGWQKNLYAVPQAGPHAQILEEQFFKRLDDVAARALFKLNASEMTPLDGVETFGWISFLQSLLHRSPENMRVIKLAGREVWRATLPELKAAYDRIRGPTDPLTYEEYVAKRDPIETEQSLLWSLPRLIMNQTVADHLRDCHWVQFPVPVNEPELLLSDDPLLRTNGMKLPGGHIAVPLSPRRLLVIASERQTIQDIDRTPIRHLVKQMNRWTVQSARHCVVASDLSQATFIRKHFGTVLKSSLGQGIVDQIYGASTSS